MSERDAAVTTTMIPERDGCYIYLGVSGDGWVTRGERWARIKSPDSIWCVRPTRLDIILSDGRQIGGEVGLDFALRLCEDWVREGRR